MPKLFQSKYFNYSYDIREFKFIINYHGAYIFKNFFIFTYLPTYLIYFGLFSSFFLLIIYSYLVLDAFMVKPVCDAAFVIS
jgi:hypothetical protein